MSHNIHKLPESDKYKNTPVTMHVFVSSIAHMGRPKKLHALIQHILVLFGMILSFYLKFFTSIVGNDSIVHPNNFVAFQMHFGLLQKTV